MVENRSTHVLTQDALKIQAAQAAVHFLLKQKDHHEALGMGTGSTINHFIDALAPYKDHFQGIVPTSHATADRLKAHGFQVIEMVDVAQLGFYVDGADEINPQGHMIKGGGGALTREKMVASISDVFVCLVDASKKVDYLGEFPLPVEVHSWVIPHTIRRFQTLGGKAILRKKADGSPFITENGFSILDVHGLHITDGVIKEQWINQWPGVLTVGLFALHPAHLCVCGTQTGAQWIDFR